MQSSPGNPHGTGERCASSTYNWVLAMGAPMTTPTPRRTCQTLDHTVVSVGPYMFQTSRAAGQQLIGQMTRQGFATAENSGQRRLALPPRLKQQLPRGGRRLHHRDGMALNQRKQRLAVDRLVRLCDDDTGTAEQWQEQFQRSDIKGDGRDRQQPVRFRASWLVPHGQEKVAEGAVRDLNALGPSRGTRSENDVGQIVGTRRHIEVAGVERRGLGQRFMDVQAAIGPGAQRRVRKPCRRDHQLWTGIVEHATDTVDRKGQVYRHVGRPCLQHRQQRHDEVDGAIQANPDQVAAAHTFPGQKARQPIRGRVELFVRQPSVGTQQRDVASLKLRRALEQLMEAATSVASL